MMVVVVVVALVRGAASPLLGPRPLLTVPSGPQLVAQPLLHAGREHDALHRRRGGGKTAKSMAMRGAR